jgi:hypothetical protein
MPARAIRNHNQLGALAKLRFVLYCGLPITPIVFMKNEPVFPQFRVSPADRRCWGEVKPFHPYFFLFFFRHSIPQLQRQILTSTEFHGLVYIHFTLPLYLDLALVHCKILMQP